MNVDNTHAANPTSGLPTSQPASSATITPSGGAWIAADPAAHGKAAVHSPNQLLHINHHQSPVDIFLQAFDAIAKTEEPAIQQAAYRSLGRADPRGMESINRRVLRALHPDKNQAQLSSPELGAKLSSLRNSYSDGRDWYLIALGPHSQVEALQRNALPEAALDATHLADVSTRFNYDSATQYDPSMGDVFFHPQNDKLWRTAERTVPGDLEDPVKYVRDENGKVTETWVPAGYIHAHFREYRVEHPVARKQFIALCLNATQQELFDFDDVRGHAEAILVEQGRDIGDMRGLIDACEAMHKWEYLKSLGVWGGIEDPKVKQRVDDFLAHASIPEVYQLASFIVPACIEHSDLPADEVVQHAREARRQHDAGNMLGAPPLVEEDLDLHGDGDYGPPSGHEFVSGMADLSVTQRLTRESLAGGSAGTEYAYPRDLSIGSNSSQ